MLTALPADEPARVRYFPKDWDSYTDFQATLREASVLEAWPPSATRAWHVYLANPPCALGGVAWDLAALLSPPRLAASPAVCACAGLRQLAVCPLITAKRTKAHKAAEEAAAGCVVGERGRFDVSFSQLEEGDFAFALAHESAEHAFTVRVPGSGRIAPQVELLEIEALSTSGRGKVRATRALPLAHGRALTLPSPPQVTWRYWALKSRDGGLKFERVMVGGVQLTAEHFYIDPTGSKASEMLMVWSHSDAERAAAVVDGVYTLDVEQLDHLQLWCAAARRCSRMRARMHSRRPRAACRRR